MAKKQKMDIEIFKGKGGIELKVKVKADTVWLTQSQMADLFNVQQPIISKHLTNIYSSRELARGGTHAKMESVQLEGKRPVRRTRDHYNLKAILAVGYRVHSQRGTEFRIWATEVLGGYLTNGFAVNLKALQNDLELHKAMDVAGYNELIREQKEVKEHIKMLGRISQLIVNRCDRLEAAINRLEKGKG